MSNIIKKTGNAIKDTDRIERIEGFGNTGSFISFRYSCKSMSSFGGKTYIRSKEQRFENGKMETEEFEGVAEGDFCTHAVREMQNIFVKQVESFFKTLSYFLPFSPREDKEK